MNAALGSAGFALPADWLTWIRIGATVVLVILALGIVGSVRR